MNLKMREKLVLFVYMILMNQCLAIGMVIIKLIATDSQIN